MLGATGYTIYWSVGPGVSSSTGTPVAGATNPYFHTGLVNGSAYYYVVTATTEDGESGASAEVRATPIAHLPGVPSAVSAAAASGQVTIGWNAASGAISHNLYWSNSPGVTKAGGNRISGVTSPYAHTGLANGTVYYYVVTAENLTGESAESAQVGV